MPDEIKPNTDPETKDPAAVTPDAAAPPPEPQKHEEPTPEKLAEETEMVLRGLGYAPPKPKEPKPAEKKEEQPPAEQKPDEPVKAVEKQGEGEESDEKDKKDGKDKQPDGVEAGKKETPTAPVMAPVPQAAPTIPVDTIREVAQEVAKAIAPKTTEPDLPSDVKREAEIYERLEKENPRYKGAKEKYLRGIKALESYQERWESAHPDETFNENAEEHKRFIESNFPEVDETDFEDARITIKAEQIAERKIAALEEKRRKEDATRRITGKVAESVESAERQLAELVDPELAKDYSGTERFAKMRGKDPIASRVLEEGAATLRDWVEQLERASDPDLNYHPPANHPVVQFAYTVENGLRSMPDDQRNQVLGWLNSRTPAKAARNRKIFCTLDESERIPANQRGKYFVLDPDDFKALMVDEFSRRAKDEITARREEYRKYAEANGWVKAAPAAETTPKASAQNPPNPAPAPAKAGGPSTVASTDAINPASKNREPEKNLADLIAAASFPGLL